jgi:hypothetical protein
MRDSQFLRREAYSCNRLLSFVSIRCQDASPYHVWQYIGDFFDVSWQGFELIVSASPPLKAIATTLTFSIPWFQSTTGKDNTPGATRTFSTLGLTLTERLDQNIGSTTWGPWQFFFQQKFTLLGNPQVADVSVTNVHDVLKVYPVWGGSKISWTVTVRFLSTCFCLSPTVYQSILI